MLTLCSDTSKYPAQTTLVHQSSSISIIVIDGLFVQNIRGVRCLERWLALMPWIRLGRNASSFVPTRQIFFWQHQTSILQTISIPAHTLPRPMMHMTVCPSSVTPNISIDEMSDSNRWRQKTKISDRTEKCSPSAPTPSIYEIVDGTKKYTWARDKRKENRDTVNKTRQTNQGDMRTVSNSQLQTPRYTRQLILRGKKPRWKKAKMEKKFLGLSKLYN